MMPISLTLHHFTLPWQVQKFLGKRSIINHRFSVGVLLDNYINANFPEIIMSLLHLQYYYKKKKNNLVFKVSQNKLVKEVFF